LTKTLVLEQEMQWAEESRQLVVESLVVADSKVGEVLPKKSKVFHSKSSSLNFSSSPFLLLVLGGKLQLQQPKVHLVAEEAGNRNQREVRYLVVLRRNVLVADVEKGEEAHRSNGRKGEGGEAEERTADHRETSEKSREESEGEAAAFYRAKNRFDCC